MEQSIVTIIIIAVVFIVAAQYLQTQNPQFGFSGDGPLATGSGDAAIKNPQPIAEPRSIISRTTSPRQSSSSQNRTTSTAKKDIQPKPGYSPYESTITITRVQRSSDPTKEYVVIRNGTYFNRIEATVLINGWTVESRKSGRIAIPAAEEIPMIDAGTRTIVLPQGGEVTITSGQTTFGRSFRENVCTSYFSQFHIFTPSLATCSAIPFNAQDLLDAGYNSECVDFVKRISRCRIPTIPYEKAGRIGNACIDYVTNTYSYLGCVARFRDEKTFFKNTWRVFLNQPSHIFDTLHDRVILRDDKGLIVDEFEY
ncbi:MAG: hypothetical protein Q7R73_04795 [bacterium]|nr:hypothetical protein [bacterium]